MKWWEIELTYFKSERETMEIQRKKNYLIKINKCWIIYTVNSH